MSRVLEEADAAPRIGVAPKTLANWRCLGRGPKYIKAGGRVGYDETDIEEWKAARRVGSTSERVAA